jgi:hypothetical protein
MKKLVSLLLLVAVSLPLSVNAGMVVSDPASYTYYVKQLKEAQTLLKAMQDQVKIATDTNDTVLRMADDVVGKYNRARGVVDDLRNIKDVLSQPRRVFSSVDKILALADDPEAQFKEVDVNLDKIFVDISDPEINPWMVQKKREIEVQKIFKDAMRSTELEMAKMPQRIEAIEKLAGQIDTTENIKDSQDLTNRLIVELITGQERMITLMSQMGQAEVAAQYTGYNEEIASEFQDRSIEKTASQESSFEKFANENDAAEKLDRPASELFGF